MNWFVIFGWAIVLMFGHAVWRSARTVHKKPRERIPDEVAGLIVIMLVIAWVIVAINRGE